MTFWPTLPLGSLCDFKNGLWTGKKPPFVEASVIRNTNFSRDGQLDFSDVAVLQVEANQLTSRRLQPGDIILEKSGGGPKQPVGRVVLFDEPDGVYSFSNFTSVIRIRDRRKLLPEFLHWFLHSQYVAGVTERMQKHTTGIRNLEFDSYKAIEVPLPPLDEQERIVAMLDEAFEGIAKATGNAERNLANARELLPTLLDQLLTTLEGTQVLDLEQAVDDDCSLSYGIVQPGDEIEDGLPIVRPTDIGEREVGVNGLKRIDPQRAAGYQRTTLKGRDLLLCVRGSTGVLSRASADLAGANVTRGIVPVRFNSKVLMQDLGYFVLRSDSIQRQIRAATYGAALMQINIRDVRKIKVAVPPLNKQPELLARLEKIADETDRLAANYTRQTSLFSEFKSGLLRKVFSGQLTGKETIAA